MKDLKSRILRIVERQIQQQLREQLTPDELAAFNKNGGITYLMKLDVLNEMNNEELIELLDEAFEEIPGENA